MAEQEAIDWGRVNMPPPIALKGTPRALDLEMRDGHPVWWVQDWTGERRSLPADSAAAEPVVDAAYAGRVANRFGKADVLAVEQLERDQWTVAGGFKPAPAAIQGVARRQGGDGALRLLLDRRRGPGDDAQ